jgi:hypothetical protein
VAGRMLSVRLWAIIDRVKDVTMKRFEDTVGDPPAGREIHSMT